MNEFYALGGRRASDFRFFWKEVLRFVRLKRLNGRKEIVTVDNETAENLSNQTSKFCKTLDIKAFNQQFQIERLTDGTNKLTVFDKICLANK